MNSHGFVLSFMTNRYPDPFGVNSNNFHFRMKLPFSNLLGVIVSVGKRGVVPLIAHLKSL